MVVKKRLPSNAYIYTLRQGGTDLPYGDGQWATPQKKSLYIPYNPSPRTPCQSKSRKALSAGLFLIKASFFIAACYFMHTLHTEVTIRESELTSIRQDLEYAEAELIRNAIKTDVANSSILNLHSHFTNLLPGGQEHIVGRGNEFNVEAVYKLIIERQNVMKERFNDLKAIAANINLKRAHKHFGSQVHKLKFSLEIDSRKYSFVVEMAPLELMPHSVNFFMEMVEAKVWDNTVFTHRSNHVLLAEERDYKGHDKRGQFLEENITTLSFPEYSGSYPHDKYTIGFGGSGPGFFINTEDNIARYGPQGQVEDDLGDEANPCFGKVIEGQDVIDWMQEKSILAMRDQNEGGVPNDIYTIIDSIRVIN